MNAILKLFGRHLWFVLLFGGLYSILLAPILFGGNSFTEGDYALQFYPWLHAYAESLKKGEWLLWTPLIGCGFPLFAEGQAGMLYVPNLVLFKFFSFNFAYNAIFVSHFFLAGLFAYIYSRQIRMSGASAALVAMIYVFGSSYAGCFYNIGSMRSVFWFPAMLFLSERYLNRPNLFWGALAAIVSSQSWLGGSTQMAFYAHGFWMLYYLIRAAEGTDGPGRAWQKGCFVWVALSGALVATPQIWASWQMAAHSTRTLQSPEFALWGSFAPWSLATLVWYDWSVFFRSNLYIGLLPILLVWLCPQWRTLRVWWALAALAFVLSLGGFNPIYWVVIHLPGASLLRNPSKFLFFFAFFLAIIAGFGLDRIHQEIVCDEEKVRRRFIIFVIALMGCGAAGWVIANKAERYLSEFGEWYVRHYVVGRSFHRYDWAVYSAKIGHILDFVKSEINANNPFFWLPMVLTAVGWIGLESFKRMGSSKKFILNSLFLAATAIDLCVYGQSRYGTGFRGNMGAPPAVNHAQADPFVLPGRILDLLDEDRAYFVPNQNMIKNQAVIGVYTPLLDKEYYALWSWTGTLDDSMGRTPVKKSRLLEAESLLDYAGVSGIVVECETRLNGAVWESVALADGGACLATRKNLSWNEYRWVGNPRIITEDSARIDYLLSAKFNPESEVVLGGESGSYELSSAASNASVRPEARDGLFQSVWVESNQPGFLVRSVSFDGGWEARIDGRPVPVIRANGAFQAIELPAGSHRVAWRYNPDYWQVGKWFYLLGMPVLCALALVGWMSRRDRLM